MFLMQTDAGPDEAGTRLRALAETSRVVTTWVFENDCYSHVYHLIVKNGLRELDKFRVRM